MPTAANRSCPACHTHQTQQWLDTRMAELLPCPYYHVTVTVPAQLRGTLRSNQSDGYGLLIIHTLWGGRANRPLALESAAATGRCCCRWMLQLSLPLDLSSAPSV